jgi:hypothetical protein
VFRFERVNFFAQGDREIVDYVSLSDGEHQWPILGMFCMVSFPNALFLLDEARVALNPQWRVRSPTRVLDMPTRRARRDVRAHRNKTAYSRTVVPSDMLETGCYLRQGQEKRGCDRPQS